MRKPGTLVYYKDENLDQVSVMFSLLTVWNDFSRG